MGTGPAPKTSRTATEESLRRGSDSPPDAAPNDPEAVAYDAGFRAGFASGQHEARLQDSLVDGWEDDAPHAPPRRVEHWSTHDDIEAVRGAPTTGPASELPRREWDDCATQYPPDDPALESRRLRSVKGTQP